jgi:hypothetical protein
MSANWAKLDALPGAYSPWTPEQLRDGQFAVLHGRFVVEVTPYDGLYQVCLRGDKLRNEDGTPVCFLSEAAAKDFCERWANASHEAGRALRWQNFLPNDFVQNFP